MWGAPIWPPTPPGARRAPGHPWRSSTLPSLLQLPPQKREHLLPRVLGLRGAIALGVREVEKCVAGGFVTVELVGLAVARELRVDLVDIRRRRVGVVQAEEPDRRRGDVFGEVEWGGPVTPRFHDVAAVEDAGGAPRCGPRAGEQIGDAPAHAEAEDGQVSDARLLHRAQVRDRGVGVSDDLVVA